MSPTAGSDAALADLALPSPNPLTGSSAGDAVSKRKKNKKKAKVRSDVPVSRVDTLLRLPGHVQTQDVGKADGNRGKCLRAAVDFGEDDIVFQEDAYVPNPPGEYVGHVVRGELCDACFAPLSSARSPRACTPCRTTCQSRWCSSVCQDWGARSHHALLCAGTNPHAGRLLELCAQQSWGAGFATIRSLARVLQTYAKAEKHRPLSLYSPPSAQESTDAATARPQPTLVNAAARDAPLATTDEVRMHLSSLATVSELGRRSHKPKDDSLAGTFMAQNSSVDTWRTLLTTALALARAALHPDPDQRIAASKQATELLGGTTDVDTSSPPISKKSAANPLWWPLEPISPGIGEDLLNFASFDKMVGRANVNMENHGSLCEYAPPLLATMLTLYCLTDLVHSQLNHACEPNVSVRHLPQSSASVRPATRVTVLAVRPILQGDELLASYLPPSLLPSSNAGPEERMALLRVRRARLWQDYAFGPCSCRRCKADEEQLPPILRARLDTELRSGEWMHVVV